MKRQLLRKLRKIVGEGHVESSTEDMLCYRYDGLERGAPPDAVVHPASVEEVAELVRAAAAAGKPVVPRGAGTGLSGGSVPLTGGIVIDLNHMNRIRAIDRENLIAEVEPGVINWDLKTAADGEGLFYPPDPSSTRVCTLGGNIAENAGGPCGVKYGVTGDYVLGLEAVLPDGNVIRTGGRNRRDVAGYDLTSLLVGSEGTLAVVTAATLRLLPRPPARRTVLLSYRELAGAGAAVAAMASSGVTPAALEIMDGITIECVEKYRPGYLQVGAAAALLLEVDGEAEGVDAQLERARAACQETGGEIVFTASDEQEAEELWESRRAISPSLGRLAPAKIGEDISVPPARVAEMIGRIQAIATDHGLTIAVFGHAGDGNLHPNILTDRRDAEQMRRADMAIKELFAAAIELGGTLSGEHGIGLAKAGFMDGAIQAQALGKMKEIKRLFDPDGIMNPGKIFG